MFIMPIPLALSQAPIVAIGGIYLPVWIFCAVGGIVAALVTRQIVLAVHGGPVRGLGALFYLLLGICFGVGSYLFFTGGLVP